MKAEKLLRVLQALRERFGVSMYNVMLCHSVGCELALEVNGQLDRAGHRYLLSKGFVFLPDNDLYAYRPAR